MSNHEDDLPLEDSLRDQLMQALTPAELAYEQRLRMRNKIIAAAQHAVPEGTTILRAEAWMKITPYLEVRELRRDADSRSHMSLMRMQPGGCVPAHRHTQEEEILVLEGECHIGQHRLSAGDMHISTPGSWHGPVTTQRGVLVFIRGEYPYPTDERSTR